MTNILRILLLFFGLCASLWADDVASRWYTLKEGKQAIIHIELFVTTTCKYCHKADAFFKELQANTPWLRVQRYVINDDKKALIRFNKLLTEQNMYDFSVPSVFFCNSRWIGFASNETTGKDLLRGLTYCKDQIEQKGSLPQATVDVLQRWANANLFDSSMIDPPSAAKYISTMALIDAINPCALFCVAGFFALLFLQDKRKNQCLTGLLFIFTLGGVHYFQQVYAGNFFGWLPFLRLPAAITGLFAFYLAGQYYRQRQPVPLFYLLTFLLALMLQSYQQTCVMNWSYIFGQWLSNQQLSTTQSILYQLAYQTVYLLLLFVSLVLYMFLTQTKYWIGFKTKLNTIGLLYLMAIGLLLIIYPLALANLLFSLFILIALFVCGWFLSKYREQITD
ncbi:hypothetical protein [Legionella worsleiensis]|uniref:Thioredoxin domain-containing protein n=1 Tax=Legionella worsleiensis TaxID=45076 RepID=A0A0W1A379_9GAMM|nr:hypothetical protein [Legionella worsleiensis]KTD75842.1 hypothetical protein Lwor_2408 [Legionella worsleiensis]STY32855.1 Uncharacterised protein [Legionella worsleiensis]